MPSLKRFAAGASALALAAGTTLAGAGVAAAQGEGSAGSLSSSSLNLGETVTDLETAAEALNGPVTVSPNEEGGPTVTYLNETEVDQRCFGFAAPYSTVIEDDLDTNYDPEDLGAALALVNALEDGGDISVLSGDEAGEPVTAGDPNPGESGDLQAALIQIVFGNTAGTALVAAGEGASWVTGAPSSPALAVLACVPDGGGDLATYTGIDPQVVANQINDKLGPLGSIGPDMISGGSVETGVTALGSLASASAGDDADTEEPPAEEPAE
ncbi:hypothetical protein [Dietzia aurantiaca]|uniref:Secreted protein n=1 Tax=Dietzia aurantiaca TaxID=983873 RepID=A0ABV9PR58_9ACTN